MRTWVNGKLLEDPLEPAISANDHGFTVGDGVFEAIKVVEGAPFAVTRHLERLARSAKSLGLPAPDLDEVRRGIEATLADQDLPLGRIRITYTGGPAPLGSGRGDHPPTLVVVTAAATAYDDTTAIVTVPWRRNEHGALAGVKSTSYAENVIFLAEAHKAGATEAVFANVAGNLCEGTGSNVFYVIDGEVRTPTLASGCLAGVTRALLLEWCDVKEVDEPFEVLNDADEVFLASTIRDVQGVSSIDGRSLPAPGPVTAAFMETWRAKEREGLDP